MDIKASSDELRKKLEAEKAANIAGARPEHAEFFDGYLRNRLGQPAQQAPMFESPDQAAARAQMQQQANRLGSIASGQTAGAGEIAVNRQVGQAVAGQQSMAQSARGGNAALAGRLAARNAATIGVDGAGMAAQAQMGDQAQANQQLASVLSGMRGQDIGIGQGNQSSQLQQTGMNNQAELGFLAQMLGMDQATLQGFLQNRQLDIQAEANKPDRIGQVLGAGATISGSFAGRPGGK